MCGGEEGDHSCVCVKQQMTIQCNLLLDQREMKEESQQSRGMNSEGVFLEAAQVDLMNYKAPYVGDVT